MVTLSLCMIVKNEEDVLARCLDCIAGIADEIIVVDTGSTDATKSIAERYTDKVYEFEWVDDFSAARNFSFSKASMDYIMWLDADDVFSDEDRKNLILLKQWLETNPADGLMMKYCSNPEPDGSVTLSYYRERLVKRERNFKWHEPVHEYLDFSGKIVNTEITVVHKKVKVGEADRNLRIYEKLLDSGGNLSVRGLFYYSRELYYAKRYHDSIRNFRAFLEKDEGWVEDKISACRDLAECCRLVGDEKGQLDSFFKSFRYDLPRAECCCGIGQFYLDKQEYGKAAFWFDLILRLEKPEGNWGFIFHECWDFIPAVHLCVCYDKLGNTDKAYEYHLLSSRLKPAHPSVLYNQQYFDTLGYPGKTKKAAAVESATLTSTTGAAGGSANEAEGTASAVVAAEDVSVKAFEGIKADATTFEGTNITTAETASSTRTESLSPAPASWAPVSEDSPAAPIRPVKTFTRIAKTSGNRLTLSMLVHNEAGRFLPDILRQHARYIDAAVILDDASTDNTLSVCCDALRGVPLHLVHNPVHSFSNEILIRKQQWEETLKTDPDWILCLDADEMFEDAFANEVRNLINQDIVDLFSFRLYDFWNETCYREDRYWSAHRYYRPFLIRPHKDFPYIWEETPQHCGRLPKNIYLLPNAQSSLRLKHLGWSKPQLRKEKYDRYMLLDPGAKYGIKEQYDSILDENPNLVEWTE